MEQYKKGFLVFKVDDNGCISSVNLQGMTIDNLSRLILEMDFVRNEIMEMISKNRIKKYGQ